MICSLRQTSRSTLLRAALLLGIVGCGSNGGRSIPQNAMELGGGHLLSLLAPRTGTVWVYDREADAVDYKGPVHEGDRVSIDADRHLRIAGTDIKTLKAPAAGEKKHRYIVYFKP